MSNSITAPVIAGLAVGIGFVILFALLPAIYEYQINSGFLPPYLRGTTAAKDVDYTPLLQMHIIGLRNSYFVGEAIEFSVSQTAGGNCVLPQLIEIKNLDTNTIVKEWNGTKQNALQFGCAVETNPATSSGTWNIRDEDHPVILNPTGSYAVIAKHLFKTVQKDFKVISIDENHKNEGTSPEVVASLSEASQKIDVVKALLEKYPNSTSTITANYYSRLFQEFQKYSPAGIVQYSTSTDSSSLPFQHRQLTVTIIFDRYYEFARASMTIAQCLGENYDSYIAASEVPLDRSVIDRC